MYIDDYTSKPKPEKKQEENKPLEAVASGKRAEDTDFDKFIKKYVKRDVSSIKKYILKEAEKNFNACMFNIGSYFLNSIFGKDVGGAISGTAQKAYRNYFEGTSAQRSNHYANETIWYDTFAQADKVLSAMKNRVESSTSGICLVADMVQFSTLTPETTDYNWGWRGQDLMGVRPMRTSKGSYYLNLPDPIPIRK